jgi:phosphatidylglycerophosphatase A
MRLKEFLFTAFYAGYCPVASGSAGTLVGMALYFLGYLIFGRAGWIVNIVAVLVLFYPFLKIAGEGERFFGKKDPPEVVIDELMGYWISVLFYPFNLKVAVAAFFVFRLMDIVKPYPIGLLHKLDGGLGIMIDDCVAGLYTNLILFGTILILKLFQINIY